MAGPFSFANEDERNAKTTAIKNELRVAIDANDFAQIRLAIRQLEDLEHEYRKSKFTNIPESMYWATVTMTTVGYGDIVPTTTAGKFVAAILILLGYSLIIVPTGFVSAEFMESRNAINSTQTCRYCMLEGHDIDAVFCKQCGHRLNEIDSL